MDEAVHGVHGTEEVRGKAKIRHVHHMRDQACGPAALDHPRGQIDAHDIESVRLEERSVGTGCRPELEQARGLLLLSKARQEVIALRGLPSRRGSHSALLDPAIIGVPEGPRHVIGHLRTGQRWSEDRPRNGPQARLFWGRRLER